MRIFQKDPMWSSQSYSRVRTF